MNGSSILDTAPKIFPAHGLPGASPKLVRAVDTLHRHQGRETLGLGRRTPAAGNPRSAAVWCCSDDPTGANPFFGGTVVLLPGRLASR